MSASRLHPELVSGRRRLAEDVRELIEREYLRGAGAVSPGELLPSENVLARRYGVSRVTVRAALQSLQQSGLIASRQGLGAVVLPRSPAIVQGLDRLASLESLARETGVTVGNTELSIRTGTATEEIAAKLEIAAGEPVLEVRRAKLLGEERAAWVEDTLPLSNPLADRIRATVSGSVVDLLLKTPEAMVAYADAELEPVVVGSTMARRLGTRPRSAAMFVEVVLHDVAGTPVAISRAWMRPEFFRFAVRRRRSRGE